MTESFGVLRSVMPMSYCVPSLLLAKPIAPPAYCMQVYCTPSFLAGFCLYMLSKTSILNVFMDLLLIALVLGLCRA